MSEQPSVRSPLGEARGIFGYRAELEEAVFEFQRREYPNRPPHRIPDNWRWMFVASAARLGITPLVWLYLKKGEVVAHQGALPVRLHVSGKELVTGWFVETMAGQAVRGTPIGPMLIKKALEDLPLNLSLGQTPQMRALQFALGWRQVCSLPSYVFVSGYRMGLRHKLPAGAAEAAAAALALLHGLRRRRGRRAPPPGVTFGHVDRFTDEHDVLWKRMAATCSCAVVRDASYLNWKYVDRPFAAFMRTEMRDRGELIGVIVTMLRDPTEVYSYRRGILVDLVVPLDRPDYVSMLIDAAVTDLQRLGAQTVTCHAWSPALTGVLERLGFARREPRFHFLLAAGGEGEQLPELLRPESWFLTQGDSDADAYTG
ncbi:MAG TPA: hypothetical protein VF339_19890 [Gammaproteobacteria bacterium]